MLLTNKIGIITYSASLKMYLADAYQIPVNYTIYTYPVFIQIQDGIMDQESMEIHQ
jgi:hypothetical protein